MGRINQVIMMTDKEYTGFVNLAGAVLIKTRKDYLRNHLMTADLDKIAEIWFATAKIDRQFYIDKLKQLKVNKNA